MLFADVVMKEGRYSVSHCLTVYLVACLDSLFFAPFSHFSCSQVVLSFPLFGLFPSSLDCVLCAPLMWLTMIIPALHKFSNWKVDMSDGELLPTTALVAQASPLSATGESWLQLLVDITRNMKEKSSSDDSNSHTAIAL